MENKSSTIHKACSVFFTFLIVVVTFVARPCAGQTSSGTISGRVIDATGGAVLDADVRLINELTGTVVTAKVQSDGGFVFPDVQPGTFTVAVRANGYKELRKRGLVLSSTERLSAGALTLEVGSISQSVTVSAATTPVQTQSAEVSGLLDTK